MLKRFITKIVLSVWEEIREEIAKMVTDAVYDALGVDMPSTPEPEGNGAHKESWKKHLASSKLRDRLLRDEGDQTCEDTPQTAG